MSLHWVRLNYLPRSRTSPGWCLGQRPTLKRLIQRRHKAFSWDKIKFNRRVSSGAKTGSGACANGGACWDPNGQLCHLFPGGMHPKTDGNIVNRQIPSVIEIPSAWNPTRGKKRLISPGSAGRIYVLIVGKDTFDFPNLAGRNGLRGVGIVDDFNLVEL